MSGAKSFPNDAPCRYVPLWCKSNYSFLEGASHPEELVEQAAALGIDTLALTDRNGLYGMGRAYVQSRTSAVELIVGAQVTLTNGAALVLLASDRQGYRNLCRLLTRGKRAAAKGGFSLSLETLCAHATGVLALWHEGGESALSPPLAGMLKAAFGDRLYMLLTRHRCAAETRLEWRIRKQAARFGLKLVAATEVLYHVPDRRALQDVLTCIKYGAPLYAASAFTRPNDQHFLRTPRSFAALFSAGGHWTDPVAAAALARTREVADRCRFRLSELRYRYPAEALPDGTTADAWLRQLTEQGARTRYGAQVPAAVRAQIDRELALISDLEYVGYFLTMCDIVRFCRQNDILCQGRGSAANSVVCYCLGITAIDPVRMQLLFERFISRQRAEPPDIDLDIAHERREEVIQYVYQKFGRQRAALVATVIRYRTRSAIREVGKTLDLEPTTLDRLAKLVGYGETLTDGDLHAVGLDPLTPQNKLFARLVGEIRGFPRHLATHPGGFILGHEPVSDLVPIENAAMEGRTVIQWDKYDVEALGLFKVDLLGLGALSVVDRCLKLIARHRGRNLSLHTIPPQDPRTFEMICKADTVGVFQIESRAQMAMLPRLQPRRFYDLVIEISLVRPGPIAGDMVHPYLRRRKGLEPVDYPHPSLKPILEKTLGVVLFQEQVMKLAMAAADYSAGEADQLRRDMAAWRREGRIEKHRKKMIPRMRKKGISQAFAERVFKQIKGFGEYGFPESHAASFALICYATAWLKCHYPAEFACALLNAQPMGFYAPATIVAEAQRHGVRVHPVDVQHSRWACTLQPDPRRGVALRMGLRYVQGVGETDAARIEAARNDQEFKSLADFVRRTRLSEKVTGALAQAGALRALEQNRRVSLWQTAALVRNGADPLPLSFPEPRPCFAALTPIERICWDYQTAGHSTAGHPLSPLRAELARQGLPSARQVTGMPASCRVRYAGLVICRQRPQTAAGVVFLTLEDETGFVNVVIWKAVYDKYRLLVKSLQFLGVTGKLQVEDEVVHLVAEQIWKPACTPAALPRSRDFH